MINMGGSRSALLGGAVIGGVRDNSAGYYNPAALAFLTTNSHSVSSNAYQLQDITFDDGIGKNLELRSSQILLVPTLVSGTISSQLIPELRLGYSLAARDFAQIEASARFESSADIIPTLHDGIHLGGGKFADAFEGNEDFSGQFQLNVNLSEFWGGLSWAMLLNDDLAFGITWFVVLRSHSQSKNANAFAVDRFSYKVASNQILESIEYWNVRTFPKIGFSYQWNELKAGLTFTMPGMYLLGQGTVAGILTSRNIIRYNEEGSSTEIPIELVGTDRQQDLKADYKSPLSIGFGLDYKIFVSTHLAFSAEYFNSVDKYTIIQPKDKIFFKGDIFNGNTADLNSKDFLRVEEAKKSIINYSIAVEHKINATLSVYLSFRTDFNNRSNIQFDGLTPGISTWNIYHASFGGMYRLENQEIAVAVTGSYGRDREYLQFANFNGAKASVLEGFITGITNKTSVLLQEIGLMLGYTYFIE